jgi:hypothetical protein
METAGPVVKSTSSPSASALGVTPYLSVNLGVSPCLSVKCEDGSLTLVQYLESLFSQSVKR